MKNFSDNNICSRIGQVRLEVAGARGKSVFAKMLDISPSTYDYYENSRVPPAELLVKIAQVADVDLRWLLTGDASVEHVSSDNPLIQRASKFLADSPAAGRALSAFLDILAGSMEFPDESPAETAPSPGIGTGVDDSWIPILGRSAAGIPAFWANQSDSDKITTLSQLIDRQKFNRSARKIKPAIADDGNTCNNSPVQIITLSESDAFAQTAEFIASEQFHAKYPDAFALRIDGESMMPEIRHGDIVMLSPSHTATDNGISVIQLKNQIGVTCKLIQYHQDNIHLISLNEQYETTTVDANQLAWSLKVLARVRV